MMSLLLLILHISITVVALVNGGCESSFDCELNGICGTNGRCKCNPGWIGETCGTIDVMPVAKRFGVWPSEKEQQAIVGNKTTLAWGFSHYYDNKTDSHHGFVNLGCYLCDQGIVGNMFIAHVESTDGIEGPYRYKDTVLPINAFNPHLIKHGDVFALYYRSDGGKSKEPWHVCIGNDPAIEKEVFSTNETEVAKEGAMNVALSKSLYGPWEIHPIFIKGWEHYHVSNPSVFALKNGQFLLAFRYNTDVQELVGIARGSSLTGPFEYITTFDTPGEDPFIYQNPHDETFHILFHVEDNRAYSKWPSLHAFSQDGINWHVSKQTKTGAFSSLISFANGETIQFSRRERPELVTHQGKTYLFTSIMYKDKSPDCKSPYAFSMIQQVRGEQQHLLSET